MHRDFLSGIITAGFRRNIRVMPGLLQGHANIPIGQFESAFGNQLFIEALIDLRAAAKVQEAIMSLEATKGHGIGQMGEKVYAPASALILCICQFDFDHVGIRRMEQEDRQ